MLAFARVFRSILPLAMTMAQPAAAELPAGAFPLGQSDLVEARSRETLAAGVTHYRISRGSADRNSPWVMTAGVARTASEKARLRACVRAAGAEPRMEAYRTTGRRPITYVEVIGGSYPNEASAKLAAQRPNGCALGTRAVAAAPYQSTGPWRLSIVEIDPAIYRGRLFSASGTGRVAGRTTTSEIARRSDALVAINGGFFAMSADEGVVGEPAGISVVAGQVQSEATLGRPYLLIRDRPHVSAEIVPFSLPWPRVKWSDGRTSQITGVNRQPGQVRDCGTIGPPQNRLPAQDETCTVADDLVAITGAAGFEPAAAGAATATVRPDGHVVEGKAVVPGSVILVGIGRGAADLRERLASGVKARLNLGFQDPSGRSEPGALYAVNGAPLLLWHGKMVHNDEAEGWAVRQRSSSRLKYVHQWSTLRNPRTAVGVGADGHIWLVVVDGREFAEANSVSARASVGLSIEELRHVMHYLGARDAINLDGGGSSAMVIRGNLVTHPSDSTGERAVGDAILLVLDAKTSREGETMGSK